MRRLGGFLACMAFLAATGAAVAQADPGHAARRAAQQIEAAALALAEAREAGDRVAALTRTVRAYEDGLAALREGLRRAAVQERAIALEFAARRDELSGLLGALQAIGRTPEPLLMVHPAGPLGTARAGMILSEVTPGLNARAAALGAELERLRILREVRAAAAESLSAGLRGAQEARSALSAAIAERRDLPVRFDADPARLRALAEAADTLDGFAANLPDRSGAAMPAGFAARKGKLPLPVAGRVLRRFGEADAAGIRRPGLVAAAPPLSLVTAPAAVTLLYAGPLLDYGNVIVLEPGDGYLLVFAGLARIYGEEGQILPEGAPLGLLGGGSPAGEEVLRPDPGGTGGVERETLYIEIRHDGNPVDPETWFTLNKEQDTR
ncbi:murein hydrolase activator EnvC family protein [Rhodovulum sp. YNF3179]